MAAKKEIDVEKEILITEETPVEDFEKLIKENVENCVDDDERISNFDKYSAEMRSVINKILFKTPPVPKEKLLATFKTYRDEACFYNPYDYNDWIREIKSNLIERKMVDAWEEIIVKNQLGLLWARDCDFFDDIEDKEPIEFYKIKNDSDDSNKRIKLTSDKVDPQETKNCSPKSNDAKSTQNVKKDKVTSADHYLKLVKEKVEEIDPDEENKKITIFDNLSKQIRDILKEAILNSADLDYNKLARDIKIYRDEACFYNPYDYNDWIVEIKNLILTRKMFSFWEKVIVKNELGLLWARDCDFFDDMEDEEPQKFYKIDSQTSKDHIKSLKVGILTPAEDYRNLVKKEVEEIDPEEDDVKMDIFDDLSNQIQTIINRLLFEEEIPELEKAAEALKAYREEACFYNPYDYNSWIKIFKSKIIEKKMLDFWKNVIVKNELGLLWARDCDFFDDMEDKEPENFYKIE
ncbi:uncharacterized protein LOC129615929 [Condylostylus longicornis]|uniref:uncharacterized protein LOC129615929 n=1 Tax=Condylostylus longicornis TaxID=2530218 RepID=UPI00244DF022|nr:uncharacterized protein LOC129615929 [Condylostylus longicornis]